MACLKLIVKAVTSKPMKHREANRVTRAQQRIEAQSNEIHTEREAAQEEARRQAALKAKNAETLRKYAEEENERKHLLDLELRRVAACKIRREEEERKASKEWHRHREENRLAERARRLVMSQALEIQRLKENARLDERKYNIQRKIEGRRKEILQVAWSLSQDKDPSEVIFTGWVSVQSNNLAWKRRYFELSKAELKLFSSKVCFTSQTQ